MFILQIESCLKFVGLDSVINLDNMYGHTTSKVILLQHFIRSCNVFYVDDDNLDITTILTKNGIMIYKVGDYNCQFLQSLIKDISGDLDNEHMSLICTLKL
jgi:hypothetical protein